jgi:glycosyltransferase involved in cell wall biosynthesis
MLLLKQKNKPLISIILSSYNWIKYIEKSIQSILNQTYKNFEFIIINDCSTNNLEQIIFNFKEKDKRIIYIKNNVNIWLTKSLNKWIKISKWKYIARIDDDDLWIENKLKKQIDFMESHIDYWLCWTNTIIINKKWEKIKHIKMRKRNENIKNNILKSNQFTHSSIIIRKIILDKVWWFYEEKYNWAEDYELWLRIWKISKLYNLSDFLVKYRWLETSISRKRWFNQEILAFNIMIKNKNNYPSFYKSLILKLGYFILKILKIKE